MFAELIILLLITKQFGTEERDCWHLKLKGKAGPVTGRGGP
jgi:hypothetical protein